jgi:cytochrome c peroxidase
VARADTQCDFVKHGSGSALCSCTAVAQGSTERCPPSEAPCQILLPRGFQCPKVPADSPLTAERIELGRFLFYDTRLSGNQTFACATCHQQAKAFTDGRAVAIGSTGELHPRSSMSLANVVYAGTLAWANPNLFNGAFGHQFGALEEQALIPMFGDQPVELGLAGRDEELFDRLRADPRYQRLFAEAFADEEGRVNLTTIQRAIGSFERTLLSGNSPYDRFALGLEDDAISASARRGERLFFEDLEVDCSHCHVLNFILSDSIEQQGQTAPERPFHNTGLYNLACADVGLPPLDLSWCNPPPPPALCDPALGDRQPLGCHCDGVGPQSMGCYPPDNTGTFPFTSKSEDMGAFKAPSLRNIAVTAPYMHDGSIATLEEVVEHYAQGGRTVTDGPYAGVGKDSPAKGQFVRGFDRTAQQKADIVEFLKALTDKEFVTNPRFSDPFAPVACPGDCDLNGTVAVNELVSSVNVSLGRSSLALCVVSDPSGNGAVTVDELVRAVRGVLDGCG